MPGPNGGRRRGFNEPQDNRARPARNVNRPARRSDVEGGQPREPNRSATGRSNLGGPAAPSRGGRPAGGGPGRTFGGGPRSPRDGQPGGTNRPGASGPGGPRPGGPRTGSSSPRAGGSLSRGFGAAHAGPMAPRGAAGHGDADRFAGGPPRDEHDHRGPSGPAHGPRDRHAANRPPEERGRPHGPVSGRGAGGAQGDRPNNGPASRSSSGGSLRNGTPQAGRDTSGERRGPSSGFTPFRGTNGAEAGGAGQPARRIGGRTAGLPLRNGESRAQGGPSPRTGGPRPQGGGPFRGGFRGGGAGNRGPVPRSAPRPRVPRPEGYDDLDKVEEKKTFLDALVDQHEDSTFGQPPPLGSTEQPARRRHVVRKSDTPEGE